MVLVVLEDCLCADRAVEVTQEMAAERGIGVDLTTFDQLMQEQRTRAKEAGKKADHYANRTSFQQILDDHGATDFVGREEMEAKATVLAVVPGDGDEVSIFLDRTPFYAESGGQVGDTGVIRTDTGTAIVDDTTFSLPGLHRHLARITEGTYGYSVLSGRPIPKERLEAIPWSSVLVEEKVGGIGRR